MDSDNNNNSKPGHSKKVSWDATLQKLKADNDKKKRLMQQHTSNSKLSMSDVIASKPVEQEAETHILRAFEKVSSGLGGGNNETDSLFRDIAADEISRASRSKDSNEHGSTEISNASEPTPGVADTSSDQRSQTKSQTKTVANAGSSKARFKSLVKRHIADNKDHSVEQTLFGLSTALSHMDGSKSKMSSTSIRTPLKEAVDGEVDLEAQDSTEHQSSEEYSDSDTHLEGNESSKKRENRHHRKGFLVDSVTDHLEQNWGVLSSFVGSRQARARAYGRKAIMYIMLPSLAIAAILFYLVENPSLCEEKVEEIEVDGQVMGMASLAPEETVQLTYDVNGTLIGNTTMAPTEVEEIPLFVCPGLGASVSWWFLFMGVRQVVTFTLALATQLIVVDYFALASRFCLNWFGPVVTLFLVQAKGWPFIAVFWAIYDLILLSGDRDYAHHWGYWQDWISLFNEENPSGNVVDHEWNTKILRLSIFIGIAVAVKRLFVSLFLGRQTFARYGEQLAEIMKSMVLIGEVATLAKDIEKFSGDYANTTTALPGTDVDSGTNSNTYQNIWQSEVEQTGSEESIKMENAAEAANAFIANRNASKTEPGGPVPPVSKRNLIAAGDNEFSHSQQMKLSEMLDAWEEPQKADQKEEKGISIGAVLQFRQALAFMKVRYPFLPAFGLADTRQHCIESAQEVYERLLLRTPEQSILPFDTLALLAKDDDEGIDQNKAKLLIKAFRPDRDGKLSKLDFVKSCDSVYKSIRLLSANISNSGQIDGAVEGIFNCLFYFLLGAITLAYLGVDPLQVFLSLSSVILAFAFMFGSSSSKYFEGILFILGQAPYGVGDRIHLSNPAQGTSIDGSSGWIVEKVSLYTTSLYWGATNERATIANGAISNLRVINAARSPCAQVFVNMKFQIDTPYEKIEIFKAAIEQFLKDRPREWLAFVGFRPTEVVVEQGYINYVTIAQHRTSWQDIGGVLSSKAELVTYELEVAKQLEMKYSAPHLPVDLQLSGPNDQPPQDIMNLAMKDRGN